VPEPPLLDDVTVELIESSNIKYFTADRVIQISIPLLHKGLEELVKQNTYRPENIENTLKAAVKHNFYYELLNAKEQLFQTWRQLLEVCLISPKCYDYLK